MTFRGNARNSKTTTTLSVRLEEQTECSLEVRALALGTTKSVVARQLIHDGLNVSGTRAVSDELLDRITIQLDENIQKLDALIELALSAAHLFNSSSEDQ
ncbi:hypothetical protein PsAD2_01831 [Pseudovibrio axinellae]|uniref:Uncharacterized protein n=1 Tax=Pseudovibrio axinellae TaxID=989403 RepID=A0A165Z6G7_9HYPH|nr:hypothetical protein [Pseudovibrio axinellae]KZL19553.1 hypothetical protein PsAD2_01831 [Pseudovibrio axinellae]SEQ31675.1 hypothetical protein SAMN05421798_102392 [Pseudovibrio axinellae]